MSVFLGEQAIRLRREQTGTDRGNAPIFTWTPMPLDAPCAFDPGGTTEPLEVGRAQVVTKPTALFVTAVDVVAGDRLRIRGTVYDVQGDPARWVSPFRSSVGGTSVELMASSEEG